MKPDGAGIDRDDARIDAALRALTQPSEEALVMLHTRLEVAADQAGVLDVAYTTIETPIGSLLLAGTDAGLVRVGFEREGHDEVLETLSSSLSPRILQAPRRLDAAIRQISEYLEGHRTSFDLPLDFSLSHGFRQEVQRSLSRIAYGHTRSYREVAELVGNPKAVRAVGSACATNPLPVVVPCHRVVRSDGSLGGYGGGIDVKTALLRLEGADIA
jgi:methylated-DNA-[protein]-cysteine S-methyltransferase